MELGQIHEALLLAGCDRRFNLIAIFVHYGIARILPGLMFHALRRAGLIFVEAVAIAVAVRIQPAKRLERRPKYLTDELAVARPMPQFRYHHRVEAGGGDRAVVATARVE